MAGSKVEELHKYLETESPGLSVEVGWDNDLRACSFRFDKGASVAHLLKISQVLLDDYAVPEIIGKLEGARWKSVLQQAGRNPVIFTGTGFKSPAK